MKNKFLISVLLMLFVMNFVSAYETDIDIKTLPFQDLQVTVLKPVAPYSSIDRFSGITDEYGDITFHLSSEISNFKLLVMLKEGEETTFSKRSSYTFVAEELVYLEVAPTDFVFIKTPVEEPEPIVEEVNDTVEEVNDTEVVEEVNEAGIAGLVTSNGGELLSKNLLYIIGGLVAMVFLSGGVVLAKKGKLHMPKMHFSHTSGGNKKEQSDRELLEDAEEKIKEAQEEIARIKKEGKGELTEKEKKIIEAKKKLIADQKELQDLTDAKD